ncbi:MAG: class I SAM-dependent methyltransferase [Sphingobacteriia bacterium]|nr:class I SAM-dependent methyltransferase [Sphingobacteriia bacterium]NCC38813.1 class I SAM-dependent methyltransferase [Gammaproteobacteria bacterium]
MRILPDPSKARRFLGYLDWLYNPFGRWEVTQVYDLLSTDVATAHGLYLNLGYWTGEEKTLDEACRGLADLLARQAEMGPGDRILDLGFGFADQDIHWMETYRPAHILGLNLTASQVAVARQRVEALGHAERIELREGSATDIPLASGSVDTVLALECAFHFRTRERFFAEALRVLRPGGRLVTADIIPLPDASDRLRRLKQRASWRLVASRFAIPAENAYPAEAYAERLAATGFESIRVDSIREQVYAPLHEYLKRHPSTLARLHPATRLPARIALGMSAETVYAGLDYILAVAVKP